MLRPREGVTAFVMDNEVCEVPANVEEVQEVKAPNGSEAIRWVLYTHESVASFNDSVSVIEMYEQRPVVEEFHKCLKTGLQVEGRQYETADRLEPVIGVICVQAVRLLQLRDVARQAPETPAKKLVPLEWVEVLGEITGRPRAINTVREFMRALAGLGGFLGRKSDGETRLADHLAWARNPHPRSPRLPCRPQKMWVRMSPAGRTDYLNC